MTELGTATLTLRADLAPLDRDLLTAQKRVAASVAAMQKMLDSLHAQAEMNLGAAQLLTDRLANTGTGGGETTVVKGGEGVPVVWGVRGPRMAGSILNPIVTVLEAASKTPLGSFAASIGESDMSAAQGNREGYATAADIAQLTSAISDLASNLTPGQQLASAGQTGLGEPQNGERTLVTLDASSRRLLEDMAATLGRIEQRGSQATAGSGDGSGRTILAAKSGGESVLAPGGGGHTLVVMPEKISWLPSQQPGMSATQLRQFEQTVNQARRTSETVIDSSSTTVNDRGGGTTVVAAKAGGQPAALSTIEAARQLGASRQQIYDLLALGKLSGSKDAQGRWRIDAGSVDVVQAGSGGSGVTVGGGGGGDGGGGILGRLGWGAGAFGMAGLGSALSFAGLGFEHVLMTAIGLLGSAAGAGVGGGLLAAGSLGKIGVGMGSDAAVMRSTIADTKTLATDYQNIAQAVAVYGKNSAQAAQAQAQLNFDIKSLGDTVGVKAEERLAKLSQAVNSYWDATSGPARVQAVSILMQGLTAVKDFIPLVEQAATQNLALISQDLRPLFAWLEGPQGMGIFNNLEALFYKELPASMGAFDQGAELLIRVVDLAAQHTGGLMAHLDALFTRLNSMDNMQLSAVIDRYINDFHLWDTFVKLLVRDVFELFHQDVGTGNSIIQTLNTMLEKLHAWETSAHGSAELQSLFMVHKQEVLELLKLIPLLVRGFGSIEFALAPALTTAFTDFVRYGVMPLADALSFIVSHSKAAAIALGGLLIMVKAGQGGVLANFAKGLLGIGTAEQAVADGEKAVAAGAVAQTASTAGTAATAGASTVETAGGAAAAGAGLRALGVLGVAEKAAAAVESAGAGAGGALDAGATKLAQLLARVGLTGAGVGVANAGIAGGEGLATAGEALGTAAGGAISAAIPGIAALLAARFLLNVTGLKNLFATQTNVSPGTPPNQIRLTPGGFQSNLPGFLGHAENTVVNTVAGLFGFNTGSVLHIKEIGDFAGYSATQLEHLLKILKPGLDIKVNGVGEGETGVRQLVQTALQRLQQWNHGFDTAWLAVNQFYRNSSHSLSALEDDFSSNMRLIASTVGLYSNTGRELMAENVGKMVQAVKDGMLSGQVGVKQGMQAIDQALDQGLQTGAITWSTEWHQMFTTVDTLYTHHKITTQQYLGDVSSIFREGVGRIKQETEASYQQMFRNLQQQEQQGVITHQQFLNKVHQAQVQANQQEKQDVGQFAAQMFTGMFATGKVQLAAAQAMAKQLNELLGPLGATKIPIPTAVGVTVGNVIGRIGSAAGGLTGGLFGASGALVQVGQPGQAGRDSVPMSIAGTPIMVAPGEQVAVLNRHQQPIVNAALAAVGYDGLPGLFSQVKRPNYMSHGGLVPGFAGGGSFSYGQLEGLWDQAGGARSMAALMAAIAEAESAGNQYAVNPSGASGLWQIMMPSNAGYVPGGEQNVFVPIDNAIAAVRILAAQGLGAWSTYTSGAYKQFLQGGVPAQLGAGAAALAQIMAPKITGQGALAQITQAAVQDLAKAMNSYAQAHAPAGAAGSAPGTMLAPPGSPVSSVEHAMMQAASQIVGLPYIWGGGHGGFSSPGYDCSGAVSYLLHAAGLLSSPLTTVGLASYGLPGAGRYITIGDLNLADPAASHTMISFFGRYLESGGPSDGGVHWDSGWSQAFPILRHPAGFAAGGLPAGVSALTGDFGEMPPAMLLARRPDLINNPMFRAYAQQRGFRLPTGGAGIGKGGKTNVPASFKHKGRKHASKPKRPVGLSTGGAPIAPPGGAGAITGPMPFSAGDMSPILALVAQTLGADGGTPTVGSGAGIGLAGSTEGTAPQMADLIAYYTGLWGGTPGVPPPTVPGGSDVFSNWQDPSSFVISTDRYGNPVTPYLSPNIDLVLKELGELVGWEKTMILAMQTALTDSRKLGPMIQAAISRRAAQVARIRQRVRENIAKIKRLKARIAQLGKEKPPYPHPKTGAERAANASFERRRKDRVADLNGQISRLEKENRALGGQPDSLPAQGTAAGELGALYAQLGTPSSGGTLAQALGSNVQASGGLYQLQGVVQSWVAALNGTGPLAGLDGGIQQQQQQLAAYQQGISALLPGASGDLANQLANNSAASSTDSQLVSLLEQQLQQQGEALAVSQLQYQALAQGLPPFAGVFHAGGTVPGPVGAERLILAQGGEVITPIGGGGAAGSPSVHLHVAEGMGWLRQFVTAEIRQNGRTIARRVGAGSPGRGGGQLIGIPQVRR